MAITSTFRQQVGTSLTVKSSGGDATVTLASLANAAYRESTKLSLPATFSQAYAVFFDVELAATPTVSTTIDIWCNPSSSATAATDNRGGTSGVDQAYTGYSANASTSVKQLQFVGSATLTVQATATVQKIFVGIWYPVQRYNSFVFVNNSGAAFHSSNTNIVLTLVPLEGTAE